MPRGGYESVSIPNDDFETARGYKPDGVTWGDCLVAGAERLNENLDSDTRRFGGGGDVDTQAVVDDLVTQLPPRIAEEMEGRLR